MRTYLLSFLFFLYAQTMFATQVTFEAKGTTGAPIENYEILLIPKEGGFQKIYRCNEPSGTIVVDIEEKGKFYYQISPSADLEIAYLPVGGEFVISDDPVNINADYRDAKKITFTATLPKGYSDDFYVEIIVPIGWPIVRSNSIVYAFPGSYNYYGNLLGSKIETFEVKDEDLAINLDYSNYTKLAMNLLKAYDHNFHADCRIESTNSNIRFYPSFEVNSDKTAYSTEVFLPYDSYSIKIEMSEYNENTEHLHYWPINKEVTLNDSDGSYINLSLENYQEVEFEVVDMPESTFLVNATILNAKEEMVSLYREFTYRYFPADTYMLEADFHYEGHTVKASQSFTVPNNGNKVVVDAGFSRQEFVKSTVTVKDISGNPLPNATVRFYQQTGIYRDEFRTNILGQGELTLLKGETYQYRVKADNYLQKEGMTEVDGSGNISISFEDYTAVLFKFEGVDISRLRNVVINYTPPIYNLKNPTTVYLPKGKHRWEIDADGYISREGGISVPQENEVHLDYTPLHKVSFVVKESANSTENMEIYEFDLHSSTGAQISFNEDGNSVHLPNGKYTWRYRVRENDYSMSGYSDFQPEFTVNNGELTVGAVHNPHIYATIIVNVINNPATILWDGYNSWDLFALKDGKRIAADYSNNNTYQFVLPRGEYTLAIDTEADACQYYATKAITVDGDKEIEFDLQSLTKYSFVLKDSDTKEYLNEDDSYVFIYNEEGHFVQSIWGKGSHEHAFAIFIEPGKYIAKAMSAGYASHTFDLNTNEGAKKHEILLKKENTHLVGFMVTDEYGIRLIDAEVELDGYGKSVVLHDFPAHFLGVDLSSPISYTATRNGYDSYRGSLSVVDVAQEAIIIEEYVVLKHSTGMPVAQQTQLSVYPTLAIDKVYINMPHSDNSVWTASLLNTNGALVMQELIVADGNPSINVASLPAGLYLLKVENGERMMVTKLVKK